MQGQLVVQSNNNKRASYNGSIEASQASSSEPYLAGTAALIHDKAAGNWKMMENAVHSATDVWTPFAR
jgi:hypothetical protein